MTMKMMMIMVIILMFDDDNAQKSSTTMTLWSKYTPFKYYYLVKKGPKQPGRGWGPPPLNGQCPFKNVFFIWTPSLRIKVLDGLNSFQFNVREGVQTKKKGGGGVDPCPVGLVLFFIK